MSVITNDDPAAGLGPLAAAGGGGGDAQHDPDAVVIALADMPRVTATQIYRLLDGARWRRRDRRVQRRRGPAPARRCSAARIFPTLLAAQRRHVGARDLVRRGHHIVAPPAELVDVDTPEDLASAGAWLIRRSPSRSA
jgi:molybdenum cofactor cytidylyltransferase